MGWRRAARQIGAGFGACILMVFALAQALAADGPLLAYGARIAGDDARTRVVIEFDGRPDFSLHYVANPYRIVIDLQETHFGFKDGALGPRGLFSDIRYGGMGEGAARIVLTARRPVAVSFAQARPDEEGRGYRLVIDTEMADEAQFSALMAGQTWEAPATLASIRQPKEDGSFVVAVDAGHGGIDTGALGATSRTEEKVVTLAFARQLAERLGREPGIKAFLTRDSDTFLSLSQRVQLSRQNGADLFISIHADTLKQKDIRGATVYTISDRASDHLAASLAERENLSDQIAGVPAESGPPEVADILIDLTRRETQAFSIAMARSVVSSFEGQINLINNPHRHAGFRVLQAPDVPSILLELGFMSNPDDEKLLLDAAWREKVAGLISAAVGTYRTTVAGNGG
ncbi:N-acetylmuramoyl-L-alanine amidase [Ensifer soli]|uniref:N-acetylmuramoyl-L-alanine amidase n=1 Tax=Ciceribacter sp. sgz301302 TaxID=3342379 RepID=UPI0035B853FE